MWSLPSFRNLLSNHKFFFYKHIPTSNMRLTYVLVFVCAAIVQASGTAVSVTKGSKALIKDGESPETVNRLRADEGMRRLAAKDGFLSFLKKKFKGAFPWTKAHKQKKRKEDIARFHRQWSDMRHAGANV
ncbi:uncharacterized protein PITG_14075 [Phytophthora infestans T30-4]|uniref:Uncharacterized protein n=2 Tax=Phytophthora infestans TaxID=4787 RepID=D0NNK5_PHYIT|nr:uncharacterized protein PITG_14075 [Phytophthora infestans T30-4]EEY62176.1 conserved hypothetical protein [Phytophthora infestans T30-4]|eukprot:XP_002899207.1 conserved hypothetical protein [Phytophthora infestans T30-4]